MEWINATLQYSMLILFDDASFFLYLGLQVGDHHTHQFLDPEFRTPPPILSGLTVVDRIRPGISDILPMIRFIDDLKRDMFPDGIREISHTEADSRQVIASPDLDLTAIGLHYLQSRLDGIVHKDHGQSRFLLHETFISTSCKRPIENADGVIGSSSTGQLLPADYARIAQTADVQPEFIEVVLSQELSSVFRDPVHSGGLDRGVLGSLDLRAGGSEHCHRTGPEHFPDLELDTKVEEPFQSHQINVPGLMRELLASHRQQSCQVIHLRNLMFFHNLTQFLDIGHICSFDNPIESLRYLAVAQGNDVLLPMYRLQFGNKFSTHLSEGSSDQYLFSHYKIQTSVIFGQFLKMSYEDRVALAIKQANEEELQQLIGEEIDPSDANVRAKEAAIHGLAQLYVDLATPEKIQLIAEKYAHRLAVFSKPRLAKITKGLVEYVAKIPNSQKLQIELSLWLIDWCVSQKRTYLKHRIEVRLAGLYLEVGEPNKAMKIIEPILIEVRKADDKLLLVELYLLESKINHRMKNYAKAKASLTASRANANNVYCQPAIIAEIDLMSGILYAQDQDYKTSYSYFYEALEPLMAAKDHRAVLCFKYMLMCKIMSNNKDDFHSLLNGKFGLKFSADSHIRSIKAVAESHFGASIVALSRVFVEFKTEIEGDEVVNSHTKLLYDNLLEKNLFKIIDSYTRVDIEYIAKKLSLSLVVIERKLSEMILDKKVTGTIDQQKGCLIIYHDENKDKLYGKSMECIFSLQQVVRKLNEASTALKQAN